MAACASVLSLELPALAVGAGLATVKGSRFSPEVTIAQTELARHECRIAGRQP
jgi:hypothetical protein